jgi:hypothetical protein
MENKFQISELKKLNGHTALYVDNNPFIILGLQLDCDSCYDSSTIDDLMKQIGVLGGNTAACLLYWRLIEPEEGQYDFSILESMIESAKRYDLRIVLVWFGSYKNACTHYAPDWFQNTPQKYRHAHLESGEQLRYVACPNCNESLEKDKQAVVKVFEYLRDYDTEKRVILFQVNNESGLIGTDRCYCEECNYLFEQGNYKATDKAIANEIFSAESILRYMEKIAKPAKEIYPLPCYMNAWLAHHTPDHKPGSEYPSGGPVYRVLDVYMQNKKFIDFVSPDIYTPGYKDFMRISKEYCLEENPLYIAEHALGKTSRAFKNLYYALGKFSAIGFDPWAIDCAFPDVMEQPLYDLMQKKFSDEAYDIMESYIPVRDAMIPIAERQGTENMKYFVQEESDTEYVMDFGDIIVKAQLCNPDNGCSRGIVLRIDTCNFVVLGVKTIISFMDKEGNYIRIKNSERGRFERRKFIPERRNTITWSTVAQSIWIKECGVSTVELDIDESSEYKKVKKRMDAIGI